MSNLRVKEIYLRHDAPKTLEKRHFRFAFHAYKRAFFTYMLSKKIYFNHLADKDVKISNDPV